MRLFKISAVFMTAVLICGFSLKLSAQNSKPVPPEDDYYSLGSSTSNTTVFTKVKPDWPQPSVQEQDILNQIHDARTSGDVVRAQQLNRQLDELTGSTPVELTPDTRTQCTKLYPHNGNPEPDYMTNLVSSDPNWSVSTATVPTGATHAGRIWVAVTRYANNASDTVKLYYSDNSGASWVYYIGWYFINYNMDYRSNENDLEVIYDGTNEWLFGIVGFVDNTNNRVWSELYRFNTTSFAFATFQPQWPGSATTTNLYYNPRLTSDNPVYEAGPYLYLCCSFDSTHTSTDHWARQKVAYTTTPFASTITVTYRTPSGGGFFWNSQSLAAGTYIWTDIAYYNPSGVDRIMTVYNIDAPSNGHNMYLAWSNDYGATVAGNLALTEANESQWARIAANSGSNNQDLMITYRRQYSGNDWDPYYRNTTTGGITLASWTANYVDASSAEAWYADVIAVRGANNLFKCAYTQDVTVGVPGGYYTGWNGSAWNSPNTTLVNNVAIDNSFGRIRAGYKLGGGDDCMAIWCGSSGANVHASRLCQTTVGTGNHNSEVPKEYALAQNYPNPFNPTTMISYSLPKSGLVKLVVYDVLGQEVKTLVNEVKNAGTYDLSFDASSLPSGIYFYKITSGSFTATKKMMLVK